MWGNSAKINQAISGYQTVLTKEPKNAIANFRLGVCYRLRYDGKNPQHGDFQKAVDHWGKALQLNPNQYIWRRRIQQYGPRLTKPYSFYDWVVLAKKEIRQRGEKPIKLNIEPTGSEFATPQKKFYEPDPTTAKTADPDGKINQDKKKLITILTTIVPGTLKSRAGGRIHLTLRPDKKQSAHWNNESEPLTIWLEANRAIKLPTNKLVAKTNPKPQSSESRSLDFEIHINKIKPTKRLILKAYALYYVCEEKNGTCLYLRQDFNIKIPLTPSR